MSGMENGVNTVTLRVNRFAPRAERARDRERGGSYVRQKSRLRLGIPACRRAAARAASSGCRITR